MSGRLEAGRTRLRHGGAQAALRGKPYHSPGLRPMLRGGAYSSRAEGLSLHSGIVESTAVQGLQPCMLIVGLKQRLKTPQCRQGSTKGTRSIQNTATANVRTQEVCLNTATRQTMLSKHTVSSPSKVTLCRRWRRCPDQSIIDGRPCNGAPAMEPPHPPMP